MNVVLITFLQGTTHLNNSLTLHTVTIKTVAMTMFHHVALILTETNSTSLRASHRHHFHYLVPSVFCHVRCNFIYLFSCFRFHTVVPYYIDHIKEARKKASFCLTPTTIQWRIQGGFLVARKPPWPYFFYRSGVRPLPAPTFTSHLNLWLLETSLETSSGYASGPSFSDTLSIPRDLGNVR